MPIQLKTPAEIDKMRIAGQLAADVLEMIGEHIKPVATVTARTRPHPLPPGPPCRHAGRAAVARAVTHRAADVDPAPRSRRLG